MARHPQNIKTSNLYYTNEYGEVVGVSITRSKLRENFEFPKDVLEEAGTKGVGYKEHKKKIKEVNQTIVYKLDTEAKIENRLNAFFNRKKAPSVSDANAIFSKVTPALQSFYTQRLQEYVKITGRKLVNDWEKAKKKEAKKTKAAQAKVKKKDKTKKKQEKKQNKNKKQVVPIVTTTSTRTTLGDIVKFVTKGRKPKYGYARDRFGRIQERDRYIEDRSVNPYNSSNSLFDREDDNTSIYDGWE